MLFSEVIGQNTIKQQLVQTVLNDRIPHAQLFHGKLGAGTFAIALAYAQFVFCSNKQESDSCGSCPSCLKIKNLSHPDLHFTFPVQLETKKKTSDAFVQEWREMIVQNAYSSEQDWYRKNGNENKKGLIGVDESAEISKKISLKSYEGGYKVSIIWLAENMNTASANKLLKLIEEPPNNTLIFLCVENLDSILPTILSRTQIIRLSQLSDVEIANELVAKHNLDEQRAYEISSYVGGDYSQALNELTQGGEGVFYFESFVSWMRLCFKKDVAGAVRFVAEVKKMGKEKQKAFLLYVLSIFQKSLIGNFVGIDNIKTSEEQKKFIQNFMPYVHERNISHLHKIMSEAHYNIDRNANAKILFLDLSFDLFKLIKK
jgi:DNA polymerase III subunit delta'